MTQEKLNRKTEIEQAINKHISQNEGAVKLKVSERHFRCLLKRYRQAGDVGLDSGNCGKSGNRKLEEDKLEAIIDPWQTPYLQDLDRLC